MLGTRFPGFAGNAGTEQVAQGSTLPLLLLERIPPCATAWGNASRPRSSAPCSPCPAPAPAFSRVAHLHCWHRALPTSVQEAHGNTRHTLYRQMLRHQRVHRDTCPPRWRSQRHRLSACWTATAPALPKPGARGSQHWVTAGSRSVASSSWVPRGAGSQHGGEPSHCSPTGG